MSTRTRLVFLQHTRESRVRIGTARMAHLALRNSEFHVGLKLPRAPGPRTAVLFPGPQAMPAAALAEGDPWTLVVVDGTWSQARKLVQRDPYLAALPRVGLTPTAPGNYRIRKEPAPHCLATVEAVAALLAEVEGKPERFSSMIDAFTYMVDRQLEAAAAPGGGRTRKPKRRRPSREAKAVREVLPQLVLLHAESNAHARSEGVAGAPELLHLAALRLSTGERFEAVLAPRRPLARAAPAHLELPEAAFFGGETAAAALARFAAFVRPGEILAAWGPYSRDLLVSEGVPVEPFFDVRIAAARRLRGRAGPAATALVTLGGSLAAGELPARGRAGRTLQAMAGIIERLAAPDPS